MTQDEYLNLVYSMTAKKGELFKSLLIACLSNGYSIEIKNFDIDEDNNNVNIEYSVLNGPSYDEEEVYSSTLNIYKPYFYTSLTELSKQYDNVDFLEITDISAIYKGKREKDEILIRYESDKVQANYFQYQTDKIESEVMDTNYFIGALNKLLGKIKTKLERS